MEVSVQDSSGSSVHVRSRSPSHKLVAKLISPVHVFDLVSVLYSGLGEVDLLEHHDVVFNLLSVLSLSQLAVQTLLLGLELT